jgi:dihydrofolate reductase
MPVFVLTHHAREPLVLGDTTFTFVTDGIDTALAQAKTAAGAKDVLISGGASVANQYLATGEVDQIDLHIAPVVLGAGARLFAGLGDGAGAFQQVRSVEGPGVTHIRYRVARPPASA